MNLKKIFLFPVSIITARRRLTQTIKIKKNIKQSKQFLSQLNINKYLEKTKIITSTPNANLESKINIFMFWWDGFDNAPELVKLCKSKLTEYYEKDFNIIFLDKNNLDKFCTIETCFQKAFETNKISIQMFSDILRFTLLKDMGGIWIDSTILFNSNMVNLKDLYTYSEFNSINSFTDNNNPWFYINDYYSPSSAYIISGWKGNKYSIRCLELIKQILNEYDNLPYFLVDIVMLIATLPERGINYSNTKLDTNYLMNSFKNFSSFNTEIVKNVPNKLDWRINYNSLIKYLKKREK